MTLVANHAIIKLTKNQQEIVDYKEPELLIKGIAGSGKTLVILAKAKSLLEKNADFKIGIFTYNKTLSKASAGLLSAEGVNDVEITTFHTWAMKNYRKITSRRFELLSTDDMKGKIHFKNAIQNIAETEHRFVKEERFLDFLIDEISWIKGRGINSFEEYMEVERKGRGSEVRVSRTDRITIYEIFEAYQISKGEKFDFDDLSVSLSKYLDKFPDEVKMDYVFIDEAQDLNMLQLMCLKAASKKAFIVAADKGQKIYKTSFSWKDIGVNITGGRTKILKDSFRSTKEIISLAQSLQKNDTIVKDEDFIMGNIPEKGGISPVIIQSCNSQSQKDVVINDIQQILLEVPNATIGVLASKWEHIYSLQKELKSNRLKHEMIKREYGNPYKPGIKLSSVHSSKGLEFDYVFLIGLEDSEQLDNLVIDMTEHWDTQRRLLYVAMTRAKTVLRMYYSGEKMPFLLSELDKDLYRKEIRDN